MLVIPSDINEHGPAMLRHSLKGEDSLFDFCCSVISFNLEEEPWDKTFF